MKVLFLQDHAETGGAARAANRYAFRLREMGVSVARACGDRATGTGEFLLRGKAPRGWARLLEICQTRAFREQICRQRTLDAWHRALNSYRPDIVWAHNLHGGCKWGWSLSLVKAALGKAAVLWTLHDLWILSRGRPYPPVEELRAEFPDCPLRQLSGFGGPHPLLLASPSRWIQDLIRKAVPEPTCHHLPYVLDTTIFRPDRREQFRQRLGLRAEDLLLLAVAENLEDPRKRISLPVSAWPKLSPLTNQGRIFLGLVGRNPPRPDRERRILAVGPVSGETEVAGFMAAADLFIHPAAAENYALVLEEAQACGTPVLAAKAGGVGETFVEGLTGWGMETAGPEALARQLNDLLARPEQLRAMRTAAREAMEQKHRPEMFSARWDEIRGILGR